MTIVHNVYFDISQSVYKCNPKRENLDSGLLLKSSGLITMLFRKNKKWHPREEQLLTYQNFKFHIFTPQEIPDIVHTGSQNSESQKK